ncbi:MAG TPA: hypothetical protein VNA66_11420 [Gammaproteobacteria bacterium]|nr:hypothetical protein [Gammaproteobacteria bacterium]
MSGALLALLGSARAAGEINGSIPNASGAPTSLWQLSNDGTYSISGESVANWVTPASAPIAALYQVKTEVTAGSFDTDPSAGAYLDLSSTRAWEKTSPGTVTFTVTFREKSTGHVRSVQAGKTVTVV